MAGNAGTTVQQIINESLGHLGVYSGDPLDAGDLASAFFTFQGLIDGWGAERLTFRQVTTYQFTATAGKQSYVVGPSALGTVDWATGFAPLDFPQGSVQMVLPGSNPIELELAIDTVDQWEAIGIKSMQSGILTDCWPDFGTVSTTLNFWPVPNASLAVNLYLPQQVATPSTTSATVILAPGYQEALTFELAIKLSSKFGAPVPAWLPEAWREAKSKIKSVNFPLLEARCDSALLSRGRESGGGSIRFYLGK